MTIGAPIYYPASPIEIRDGTASRLAAIPALKNVYKARTVPTKPDQVPLAAVWLAQEQTEPNGDSNVGAPSFIHTLTLVIDVMANGADETALDASIVNLVQTIQATLLTDYTWVNLFEGIERCNTRYAYPKEGDTFLAQAIIEIEVTFRSEWPPYVPNDFTTVVVTTNRSDQHPANWNAFATEFDIPEGSCT